MNTFTAHFMCLPSCFPLTKLNVHGVLARLDLDPGELSHTHVTSLVLLSGTADDDASLPVAVVPHSRGQRSPIARLQIQAGDLGVGHQTGYDAVFTRFHQNVVHDGALEGIQGV